MEYLLFEMSKRLTDRHAQRTYLKKLNEGLNNIKASQLGYFEYLQQKEIDLNKALENIVFFRTSLNPTQKEIKNMAFFKLEAVHAGFLKKQKVLDMPTGICHEIVGDIPVTTLEKLGVIERLAYGFRRDTKMGLILHYSHSQALGWNFEVIFTKGSNKDMISQFSITNQQFLDIKRTTNSEAKLEVKDF